MTAPPSIPAAPRLRQALWFWFKLGLISFGGPAGQIALMHRELVERRRWLSEGRFLHALNYCMLLPGPEAQQLATYLGWLLHRTWGGVLAGVLFILPSLLLMIGLGWLYLKHADLAWVQGVFYGIKPAVTVIVLQAAWRVGGRTLRGPLSGAIAVAAFVGLLAFQLPFPLLIAGAALLGYLGGRWLPKASLARVPERGLPAVIDDDTPPAAHSQFRWARFVRVLLVAAVLWLLPMSLLLLSYGWHGDFTQMAWFFTKAALLSFGGAYAVLPYVSQAAIYQFAWVSPGQMIDGLALGETTPGPLIMIVAFIAFVAAYPLSIPGMDSEFWRAALAALLVSWFTFLPSFVFILAGAPLVEASHGKLPLASALSGISAAVVGVIANLALFFGYHVFWPEGLSASLDVLAVAIALCAGLALWLGKCSVLSVIIGSGLLGVLLSSWQ